MQHILVIGNLANDVELTGSGDTARARFTLIENAYAGKDDQGQDKVITTSFPIVAFRGLAETVHKHFMKGDEIKAEIKIRNNNYEKEGTKHYEHSFILDGFDFGAKGKKSRDLKAQQASN